MQTRLLTIFLLFFALRLSAQDDKIVETDSSIITTKYFEYDNAIRVFNELKRRDKTYYTEYYFDTHRLRETGVFFNGPSVGIWKLYSPKGNLIQKLDYDKGTFVYYDKKTFPYYAYRNNFKLKADSIIKRIYGQAFFDRHITWNIGGSNVYEYSWSETPEDWLDSKTPKPVKFVLSYTVKFDGRQCFDMMDFTIDDKGRLVMDKELKGIEKLPVNLKSPNFVCSGGEFIDAARQNGLLETASAKASVMLTWEENKSTSLYRGRFLVYVSIKTASVKHLNPKGRSTVIDKYDVYVFNPWTGAFIQKKKMETWRGWEQNSGSSSGLVTVKN